MEVDKDLLGMDQEDMVDEIMRLRKEREEILTLLATAQRLLNSALDLLK